MHHFRSKLCFLFVLSTLCFMRSACGVPAENVKTLMDDLLVNSNYSRYIRPVLDQGNVLEINVGFQLIAILGFDEIGDEVTVKAAVDVKWVDEFLNWNSMDYGGIDAINVPSELIWIPNLMMTTANSELAKFNAKGSNVKLYSNGTLHWVHADVLKSRCLANVKNFPLDVQSCILFINPLGYQASELTLTKGTVNFIQNEFDNGQWERKSVSTAYATLTGPINLPVMTVTIEFHRKSLYMVLNIIIPIVMLNCLCILAFHVPVESGERVSYAVTLLLSNTVFLLLLSDNLPKISDPVPTVCVYLIVNMISSLFVCLCTIVNVRMFHRKDDVPLYWQTFEASNVFCFRKRSSNKVYDAAEDQQNQPDLLDGNKDDVQNRIRQTIKSLMEDRKKKMAEICSWNDVSRKLDTLLFILFAGFSLIVNITFVIYINIAI